MLRNLENKKLVYIFLFILFLFYSTIITLFASLDNYETDRDQKFCKLATS